jgi:hypothetical protein
VNISPESLLPEAMTAESSSFEIIGTQSGIYRLFPSTEFHKSRAGRPCHGHRRTLHGLHPWIRAGVNYVAVFANNSTKAGAAEFVL